MKRTVMIVLAWLATLPLPMLAQPTGPGAALSFQGDGYVSIATTGALTGTFTVELWANPGTNTPTDLLALFGSRTPDEFGFDMKFWLGHLIHGDIGNGINWLTIAADAEYRYVPGDWVHVAYVVTPADYSIYANGQWLAGGNYSSDNPVLYDANHQLTIGHIGYGPEYMTGQIDEVRIWNAARSQSEIQANLQRRLSGSEPGLMAYWRFDEGTGPLVYDASGHGFIGQLFDGPVWVNSTAPIGTLVATTAAASGITPNSATLNGMVFPNFGNAGAWFEYGTTTNYGSATAVTVIDGANGIPVAVSSPISGLSLGTLYHFRLVATNGAATSFGADSTFTASTVPLVVNGGFETGDFTAWSQSGYTWENYVDTDPWDVHSGIYGAGFGPVGTFGYLSQTLATTAGGSYVISFWLDSPDGDTPNQFSVEWNGTTLMNAVDLGAIGWTNIQLKVFATSTSSVLRFGFRNDPSYFGFDDVSVEAVSPPDFLLAGSTLINGQLLLQWTSLAEQIYQVQYSTSLEVPVWNDLGSPITATESTTSVLDSVGQDSQRFYRVVLLP